MIYLLLIISICYYFLRDFFLYINVLFQISWLVSRYDEKTFVNGFRLPCYQLSIQQEYQYFTHPTLRLRGDVATTSLCTSQQRRSYVLNETPNDVSMERRQDVSVMRLHDVLLERRNDVSKGRNNYVPSLYLHDVSNKSQIKHPTTSQWYVTKTSQWYVSTTSHLHVSTASLVSPK